MPKKVIDNGSNWNNVEGFLKIPFSSFTDEKRVIRQVTKGLIFQAVQAGINQNAFQNFKNGPMKSVTVFLEDGTSIMLDLTKLKP